jgi:hypothetical protein
MAINVKNKITTSKCPHRNKDIVYDHQMRMIQKCYDCGEETLLEQPKQQPSSICATHYGYNSGACAIGYNSHAYGVASSATTGQYNISIGAGALNYAADYETNYNTDMRFSDTLRTDLEEYKMQLAKQQAKQHSKLDVLKSKVEQYKKDIANKQSSNVETEIDRIRAKYDETLNRVKSDSSLIGGFANAVADTVLDPIRQKPTPPPFPQKRKVGAYNPSSDRGYHGEKAPQKPISEYTDIEVVQFLIRNTTFEEKTYEDVKYLDFIFHSPISQTDSRLDILESGDVLEWKKLPKNPKLGILSPKIKAIKSIRISVEDLKNARKEKANES